MSEYIAKCNEVVGISGKTLIVPDYIDTSKEIVRCRDCKYAMAYAKAAYCDYMNHVIGIGGFCAWGEMREHKSAEVWNQWNADDVTCSEES